MLQTQTGPNHPPSHLLSCGGKGAYLLEVGYSSTVTTWMPFQAATLTPQNRHCSAMMAAWLKLRNRKMVQPAEMSMEPPEEEGFRRGREAFK